jgi:hypothetical protein
MAIPSSNSETTPVAETDGKRKQARQWRSAKIQRFVQTQRRKREWYSFAEIAEMCSELDGSGVPNEAARENAYRNLERDVLDGDFQENSRSRVLYLHPLTVRTRMTPGWLNDVIEYDYDGHRGRSQYLPWCWCSRGAYERFASKHNLPISPPRFQPEHADTAVVAQPTASEQPEHADTAVVAQPTASEQPEHTDNAVVAQPTASEQPEHADTAVVAQPTASEQPEHTDNAVVAQPTASEKLPRAIAKRRRPAEERIRQELEKKAPEFIDTPGDKTCWSIAQILVETRGSALKFDLDKTSKALKRYYAQRPKD